MLGRLRTPRSQPVIAPDAVRARTPGGCQRCIICWACDEKVPHRRGTGFFS